MLNFVQTCTSENSAAEPGKATYRRDSHPVPSEKPEALSSALKNERRNPWFPVRDGLGATGKSFYGLSPSPCMLEINSVFTVHIPKRFVDYIPHRPAVLVLEGVDGLYELSYVSDTLFA